MVKKIERRETRMSLFWIFAFAFVLKYWIRNTSQFKWRTLSLTKSNVNCETEFEISLFLCFVKQLYNKRSKSFRHESVSMSFYSLCSVEHWPQIYQISILISITPYNIFVISQTFKTVSLWDTPCLVPHFWETLWGTTCSQSFILMWNLFLVSKNEKHFQNNKFIKIKFWNIENWCELRVSNCVVNLALVLIVKKQWTFFVLLSYIFYSHKTLQKLSMIFCQQKWNKMG